ncbi:MAG TPA: bifunctional diaminohydroxyphosphoribosylaminopyrimidine deaminase/5-amino-6-(5-phosphoribosylamino)uracil reductase RibD, partial [Terriglobales bacterium]|nr:bifunctional diaminohydroxyphosphoribosylaminopyrimidine deaminase/5-amino-6-(5-phosphoribosylamino)uracil reductase RibD [Terriglobales bacterium]
VGAVVVRAGQIVATGYHRFAGGDHAEIMALKRAGEKARGATLYINLEPCNHQGRTPPCTDRLIGSGIKEVVAGMKDPNPRVAGRGLERLRAAGIRVRSGVLESECRALNEAFEKYITRGLPFVTLKLAASLDGKIATASGDSRWISDEDSRRAVHRLRNQQDAVLVGSRTAVADDPQLTCRIAGGRDPWRVVLDPWLRIPVSARLFRAAADGKTLVLAAKDAGEAKVRELEGLGARVLRFSTRAGKIPWRSLLRTLGGMGIVSLLIEGGATTAAWALKEKAVDKVLFFYAAKIFGGDGRVMIDPIAIKRVCQAIVVQRMTVQRSGTDILVSGYIKTGG